MYKNFFINYYANDRLFENVPNISPHAQEVFLQKRFDLAPTSNLITVREVAAIIALQD